MRREHRKKGPELLQRAALVEGLRAMVPALQRIAVEGEAMGMEAEVLKHLRPGLTARAQELTALA